MVWLMISRVDNARWRSLSNRESGCMKKSEIGPGRQENGYKASEKTNTVCERENAELLILHTILLCCFWWSSALLIHFFFFFHTSHCLTDHPAQEFFKSRKLRVWEAILCSFKKHQSEDDLFCFSLRKLGLYLSNYKVLSEKSNSELL